MAQIHTRMPVILAEATLAFSRTTTSGGAGDSFKAWGQTNARANSKNCRAERS
jgi:hypothetical protein